MLHHLSSLLCVGESLCVKDQKGLMTVGAIPAATALPYTVIAKPPSEGPYQMQAEYMNARGQTLSFPDWKLCGDPASLQHLPPVWSYAAYVNEASDSPPNCMLVLNTKLRRKDIQRSYKQGAPIVCAFLVTTRDIGAGEELLTLYGDDYCGRQYSVWGEEFDDDTIDSAIEAVESLSIVFPEHMATQQA